MRQAMLSCLLVLTSICHAQENLYFYLDNFFTAKTKLAGSTQSKLKEAALESLNQVGLAGKYTLVFIDKSVPAPGDKYIRMLSSYRYLTAEGDAPIPKFIVHKEGWKTPYYYSYFISRRGSAFNSFNDLKDVDTLYLQKESMSGYYSALYRLWELNLIKNPSVKSVEDELKKKVVLVSSADSVIYFVSRNHNSIGATGVDTFSNTNVEIKIINQILPQDVLCISPNLTEDEEKISQLIKLIFDSDGTGNQLGTTVSRLSLFEKRYQNSYEFNRKIIEIVDQTKNKYDPQVHLSKMFPLDENISLGSIIEFFRNASMSVYLSLLSLLSIVYVLGHNTGHVFLPFIQKIKDGLSISKKPRQSNSN